MFGLKSYFICGIIALSFFGISGYFINNYFNMKVAIKIYAKQLALLEHRRIATDEATANSESELYNNLALQHEALYQIQHQGYISGSSNPKWMLQYQTKSN